MSGDLPLSDRVRALHAEVLAARPALCIERAVLVTRAARKARSDEPAVVRRAEALAAVLRGKRARIYDRELLVGNFTSHRVGAGLVPELHGVAMLEDLFRFDGRAVNPLAVSATDRRTLLTKVLPYWLPRFMAVRALPPLRALRFVGEQLRPRSYLINETAGVSHFVPDYAALLELGTDGLRARAAERARGLGPCDPRAAFARAVRIVCDGLDAFADGYRREATLLASREADPVRRAELERISAILAVVPCRRAETLHEALQSVVLAQIALNLESLDNSVSPGRLDQVLWPAYARDRAAGWAGPAEAFELLGCFAVKLCEIVPAFSRRATRFHGGLFNGQVVVVGGQDRDGRDATNELTHLFLQLMAELRTRQPNYHARLHRGTPPAVRARVARALADGAGSPAVYNDEIIVPLLQGRGISEADARDYATVGCVEPVAAGRSFLSTDAALFNLPRCLDLALGAPDVDTCTSVDQVFERFRQEVVRGVERMLSDLRAMERGNARFHPTPLCSTLLDGCLETLRDATQGGARYNGSGVQGVGAVQVGESLAALDAVVFVERAATLKEVVAACRADFHGHDALRARLLRAPKYGNDDPSADRFVARVMAAFADALGGRETTRGGRYAAGFYSVTAHQAFGEVVGALPCGRHAGAPFSSGLSPTSGMDRRGPTALLQSVASLPLGVAQNGVNVNLSLPLGLAGGPEGAPRIEALIAGGFAAGAMQLQVSVLDPRVLREARDRPGTHPGLLVRVSGYSAYFDDLSPEMQQEVIDRFAAA